MRSRIVKPGFFKNEDLARLDPLARILFEGLWCMADRDGRIEDRPARIKAEVLPYDAADVEQLLDALAAKPGPWSDPFIVRYAVGGGRFIQITNPENINPASREPASRIPPQESPKPTESLMAVSEHEPSTDKTLPEHGQDTARNTDILSCPCPDLCPDPDPTTPPTRERADPERSHNPPGAGYREVEESAQRIWPRLAVQGIPRRLRPDIVGALERGDSPGTITACLEDAARQGHDIGWAVRFRVATGWAPGPGREAGPAGRRGGPSQPMTERNQARIEAGLERAGVDFIRGTPDA